MEYYIDRIMIVLVVPIIAYYGCKIVKNKIKSYAVNLVLEESKNLTEDRSKQFKISGNSALITFQNGGKVYHVAVPYNRSKLRCMLRKKVHLIKSDGTEIDITHKPGIPYLQAASEMGGDEIRINKNGEIIGTYVGSEIPLYLE